MGSSPSPVNQSKEAAIQFVAMPEFWKVFRANRRIRYSKLPVAPWKPLSACLASHFMTRVPL